MLLKRIISGVVLVGVVIASIFIDWQYNLRLCDIIITILIILGLHEFFSMLKHKGITTYKYFGIGVGAIIPLSIMLQFELTKRWEFLFIVTALLFLIFMQFKRRENAGVTVDISTTLFGILYVSWLFSFLLKLKYLEHGLGILTSLLLITKLGDIGAYFIGSRFGKTPLLPHISPKKTVEGAVAGIFFSVFGALISRFFLNFSYPHLIFLGVSFGIIGQLGDLSESLIKRDCQVKDSGNLLPGMGGILDEIDSLLFTAPVFYFYLK
ncbi:MAG: phosphatidate cytidylyltransferase [Candidatus Omnitrophota bacterium]|nr:phosphatidate cytidylyltransferase [Candidatus Omnitrophota bacterium]